MNSSLLMMPSSFCEEEGERGVVRRRRGQHRVGGLLLSLSHSRNKSITRTAFVCRDSRSLRKSHRHVAIEKGGGVVSGARTGRRWGGGAGVCQRNRRSGGCSPLQHHQLRVLALLLRVRPVN